MKVLQIVLFAFAISAITAVAVQPKIRDIQTHTEDLYGLPKSKGSNTSSSDHGSSPVGEQHSKGAQTHDGYDGILNSYNNIEKIPPKIENSFGDEIRGHDDNEELIGNSRSSASNSNNYAGRYSRKTTRPTRKTTKARTTTTTRRTTKARTTTTTTRRTTTTTQRTTTRKSSTTTIPSNTTTTTKPSHLSLWY